MTIQSLRNWLNLVFVVVAAVGMAIYFLSSKETGTYVILASMVFKFIEVVLRMMKL